MTIPSPAGQDVPSGDDIRAGDAAYVSLWGPDKARAARFFSSVRGWPPGGTRLTERAAADHGLAGGVDPGTLMVAYAIDDVDATVERIRAAGGSADEPTTQPWGRTAMGRDPDGLRFSVYEMPLAGRSPRPRGEVHGDLTYVVMEVIDAERSRAFYTATLGWTFTPGTTPGGWDVDTVPMTGPATAQGHGSSAACQDDQGTRFWLLQIPD